MRMKAFHYDGVILARICVDGAFNLNRNPWMLPGKALNQVH